MEEQIAFDRMVPVASGLIAGESLLGAGISLVIDLLTAAGRL